MTAIAWRPGRVGGSAPGLRRSLRRLGGRLGLTLLALAVLAGFLMPLAWMGLTALKDQAQITDQSRSPSQDASRRSSSTRRTRRPV